jgi:hypothetical protein
MLTAHFRYVSPEYRPAIWVRVLPALENILYGANLSNIISANQHTVLDVLAWFPYGLVHYVSPVIVCGCMFIWGPPGTLPTFARAFGYMNITAVLIQMVFPCSPPWYENTYGLAPANYSIHGDAAGLKAMDRILGFDMYTSAFQASPVVFGAFPSLHSGWATLETLFMGHVFPKLFPVYVFYTMWLWWSTMYLQHHYAVDLVAGSLRKFISNSIFCNDCTNIFQLPVSATSSAAPTSCRASSPTRSSAGTTIMSRLAIHRTAPATACWTSTRSSSLNPTLTTGPAALPRPTPPVAVAPWAHARLQTTLRASGTAIPLPLTPSLRSTEHINVITLPALLQQHIPTTAHHVLLVTVFMIHASQRSFVFASISATTSIEPRSIDLGNIRPASAPASAQTACIAPFASGQPHSNTFLRCG